MSDEDRFVLVARKGGHVIFLKKPSPFFYCDKKVLIIIGRGD
jgi:hypothetical protein